MFVYVRVRNREGGNVVSILLYLKKKKISLVSILWHNIGEVILRYEISLSPLHLS